MTARHAVNACGVVRRSRDRTKAASQVAQISLHIPSPASSWRDGRTDVDESEKAQALQICPTMNLSTSVAPNRLPSCRSCWWATKCQYFCSPPGTGSPTGNSPKILHQHCNHLYYNLLYWPAGVKDGSGGSSGAAFDRPSMTRVPNSFGI